MLLIHVSVEYVGTCFHLSCHGIPYLEYSYDGNVPWFGVFYRSHANWIIIGLQLPHLEKSCPGHLSACAWLQYIVTKKVG